MRLFDESKPEVADALAFLKPHVPTALIDDAETLLRKSEDHRKTIAVALALVQAKTMLLGEAERMRRVAVAVTALHLALMRLERA